jgi:hypothetical protein
MDANEDDSWIIVAPRFFLFAKDKFVPAPNKLFNHKVLAVKLPSNYLNGIGIAIIDFETKQLEACGLLVLFKQPNINETAVFIAKKLRQFWEEKTASFHEPKTLRIGYPKIASDLDKQRIQPNISIAIRILCGHIENSFKADTMLRADQKSASTTLEVFFSNLDLVSRNVLTQTLKNVSTQCIQSIVAAVALGISAVESRSATTFSPFFENEELGTRVFQNSNLSRSYAPQSNFFSAKQMSSASSI